MNCLFKYEVISVLFMREVIFRVPNQV